MRIGRIQNPANGARAANSPACPSAESCPAKRVALELPCWPARRSEEKPLRVEETHARAARALDRRAEDRRGRAHARVRAVAAGEARHRAHDHDGRVGPLRQRERGEREHGRGGVLRGGAAERGAAGVRAAGGHAAATTTSTRGRSRGAARSTSRNLQSAWRPPSPAAPKRASAPAAAREEGRAKVPLPRAPGAELGARSPRGYKPVADKERATARARDAARGCDVALVRAHPVERLHPRLRDDRREASEGAARPGLRRAAAPRAAAGASLGRLARSG